MKARAVAADIAGLGWLLLFVTLAGFFGRQFWWFEIIANFRVQLAGAALTLLPFALFGRRQQLPTLAALVINIVCLGPMLSQPPAAPVGGKALTVTVFNLYHSPRDIDATVAALCALDTDVLVLIEAEMPAWLAEVDRIVDCYPHGGKGRQAVILSRLPTDEWYQEQVDDSWLLTSALTVAAPLGPVRIIASHPPATVPLLVGNDRADLRRAALLSLAAQARASAIPAVVVGDLNTTPTSPWFLDMLRAGGLRSVAQGEGPFPTWPHLPYLLWPLALQLDHLLLTPALRAQSVERLGELGSDHLPVRARLVLAP